MTVKELHREAMRLTDLALIAKKSEPNKVLGYYKLAFEKEKEAAFLYIEKVGEEPSRSILLRSAANLAFLSNQHEEAEELANKGLEGKPPIQVADELKDILEQIDTNSKKSQKSINEKNGTVSKRRKKRIKQDIKEEVPACSYLKENGSNKASVIELRGKNKVTKSDLMEHAQKGANTVISESGFTEDAIAYKNRYRPHMTLSDKKDS